MNCRAYASDVSDDKRAFVASYLRLITEDAPQRVYNLREVFNGLRYTGPRVTLPKASACYIMRTMTVPVVSQLLFLLDEAFEDQKWHSLLNNLRAATPDDWTWVPPDGRRSIRDIVLHVGGGKLMYHNQAFSDASLTWDDPIIEDNEAVITIPSAIEWLRQGQQRLRQSIAALDDDELLLPRNTHLGMKETRWIICVIITHDLYHAGEINHIRCLRQQDDE